MEKEDLVERLVEFLNECYKDELLTAINEGKKSVEVDFSLLDKFDVELADYLLENPEKVMSAIEEALKQIDIGFPEPKLKIRFYNLPESRNIRIRNIRSEHLEKLIVVDGIVKRASEVRPEVSEAIFQCPECGRSITIIQTERFVSPPIECECGNRKGFRLTEQKLYDARWVMIEEPYEVVTGEKPSEIMVYLKEDLTSPKMQSKTDPGNRIKIVGVLKKLPRRVKGSRSRQMDIFIDANHVESVEAMWEELEITSEDEKKIVETAKSPDVFDKLIASIAPTMYGMEDVKEALVLQLFGADPKVLKDKTRIRGNIHILLIGDPSSGKCVHGDTYVSLQDGSIKKIKEIVEEALSKNVAEIDDGFYSFTNHDVYSLNFDGSISPSIANIAWKRNAPEFLYRVQTASGAELITTPTHLFFSIQDGEVISVKCKELSPGSYIACPRLLPIEGKEVELDISPDRRPRSKHIGLPAKITKEFCRLIGYIISEGYIEGSSATVYFTNEDEEILKDFEHCLKETFSDLEISRCKRQPGKKAVELYVSSTEFVDFLRKLDVSLLEKSSRKKTPTILLKTSNENLKELIKAIFDGDAEIKKEGSIVLTTASKELASQLRLLLLRFGIISQLCPTWKRAKSSTMEKKKYYRLTISGENALKYTEKIGFTSSSKLNKVKKIPKRKFHTNIDVIPNLSKILRRIRESLRMDQSELDIPSSTYQHFERGDRNPSRASLKTITDSFDERIKLLEDILGKIQTLKDIKLIRQVLNVSQQELARKTGTSQSLISLYERGRVKRINKSTFERIKSELYKICSEMISVKKDAKKLELLANSRIFWDRISKIEKIKPDEEYVYDLQVLPFHNFVANNVIVHNSQLMQLISKLIPRGKYVSGSGVTAAGITATVVRDEEFLGGWVLEAGALVMANRSICCLHPDTRVILDGKLLPISCLFDERKSEKILCNQELMEMNELTGSVLSFNIDSLKLSEENATLLRRRKYRGKMLNIKLGSGFEIKVTPEHELIDGNSLKWKKASEFKEGEYVLAPLKLPNTSKEMLIFDLIPDDWKVCLTKSEKGEIKKEILKKYGSIASFNRKFSLKKSVFSGGCQLSKKQFVEIATDLEVIDEWKKRPLRYARKSSSRRLKVVRMTPELAYILGFLFGDGYISRRNSSVIAITQSIKHQKYIDRLDDCWKKVFGIKLHEWTGRRTSKIKGRSFTTSLKNLYFGSNLLAKIYERAIGKSLENLLTLPDDALKGFVAGLLDSDGCVEIKRSIKGNKEYKVARVEFLISNKKETNLNLILVLRRFDVYSKFIHGKSKVDIVRITGRDDVSKLLQELKDYSEKAKVQVPERLHNVSSTSNKLPSLIVSEVCKKIADKINTSLLNQNGVRNIYDYINLKYQPSREGLKDISDRLGEVINNEIKNEIENLVRRDFFLDEIVKIEVENYEGYVYDLYVPQTHNFVAEGVFVHNCIDEFSKVNPQDRVALQEAMSLETISIAKASIVATLPAQTAILAGGNPKLGRFDPYIPVREQVDIDDVLLSRFDLKFALRDVPDVEVDRRIAEHILRVRQFEEEAKPLLEPEFIRKYVAYARAHVHPKLTTEAGNRLKEFYLEMRLKAGEEAPVAITLRQYEALLRLAEASARIRLSDEIEMEDAERAIRLMKVSLRQFGFEPETGAIDIDRAEGARITSAQRSKIRIMLDIIEELSNTFGKEIPFDEVIKKAKEQNVEHPEDILRKMQQEGIVYSPRDGFVSKV